MPMPMPDGTTVYETDLNADGELVLEILPTPESCIAQAVYATYGHNGIWTFTDYLCVPTAVTMAIRVAAEAKRLEMGF